MLHWSLMGYYLFVKRMVTDHNYSIRDVDNMIPFERDIFVSLINDDIENKKQTNSPQQGAPTEF